MPKKSGLSGDALSAVLRNLTDEKNDINYVMIRLDGNFPFLFIVSLPPWRIYLVGTH